MRRPQPICHLFDPSGSLGFSYLFYFTPLGAKYLNYKDRHTFPIRAAGAGRGEFAFGEVYSYCSCWR